MSRAFIPILLWAGCEEPVAVTPGPGQATTEITESSGQVWRGRGEVLLTGPGAAELPVEASAMELGAAWDLSWELGDAYELVADGASARLQVSAVPWRGPGEQGESPVAGAVRVGTLWTRDEPDPLEVEVRLGDGKECVLTVQEDPRLGSVYCPSVVVRVDGQDGPEVELSASWGTP